MFVSGSVKPSRVEKALFSAEVLLVGTVALGGSWESLAWVMSSCLPAR